MGGGRAAKENEGKGCDIGCPRYGVLDPKIPPLKPLHTTNDSKKIDQRPSEVTQPSIRKNTSVSMKHPCPLHEVNPSYQDEIVQIRLGEIT